MELKELSLAVEMGSVKKVKELVVKAIEEKIEPATILNDGMISAMAVIGIKFKNGEIYVPEMLIAARAMNAGLQILGPILAETGVKPIGKAIIGTVKGDLHDIGKNLVSMMLKGVGIEVYDLGIDVSPEEFVKKAKELDVDIVCISALLTTTMPRIREVIDLFKQSDVRDNYHIMIGGAPVTNEFAKKVGADMYTPDAATAGEKAREYLISR